MQMDSSQWKVQPLFAWFDAESWGQLGSRQFARDLKKGNLKAHNITENNVKSIISFKQVGSVNGTNLFW